MNYKLFLLILATTIIFALRAVAFASQYGAVEHDSGWYLGVARNLAQRGIYASYTNTIRETGEGAHPSLHGRFSVQDTEGFSYFPAGVTAGPGYVIPQAMLLKLTGFGWWQYRLWPLAGFVGMLLLLSLITFQIGGSLALALFLLWLWLIPQAYITFAYEAFGEPIALFYLLASFLSLTNAHRRKHPTWTFFFSGALFALAVLTKVLFAISAVAYLALSVKEWVAQKKHRREIAKNWGAFALGAFLPIAAFELYRYAVLTLKFGPDAWQSINQDILLTFRNYGSGTNPQEINWSFIAQKLTLWREVGIRSQTIAWLLLIGSLFYPRLKEKTSAKTLHILLYTSTAANFLWFLALSPTGWTRHTWPALLMGMALITSLIGTSIASLKNRGKVVALLATVVLTPFILEPERVNPAFIFTQDDITRWETFRYQRRLQGLPHSPLFSLSDQQELVEYAQGNLQKGDRVYYLGWLLVAEAAPLIDKVFYTIDRYTAMGLVNPDGGKSLLILGPYQKGRHSPVGPAYEDRKLRELCTAVLFKNPSYTLCELKTDLVYTNQAYQ